MDLVAGLMLIAALAGLVGLPVMMIRSLRRSFDAPARPAGAGRGRELRSSPASYYAAAFCLLAPLGVAARLRIGLHEPDYSVWSAGPLAGIVFAAFATGVAIFLAVRARWRRVVWDDEGVRGRGRQYRWSDLVGAGAPKRRGPCVVARFADGFELVVRADMEGRADFEKFLRQVAKRRGLRWGRLGG